MKEKLLLTFFLFSISGCFAQTQKLKKGKVLNENFPLQGIEVLNLNSKKTTKTDTNGEFSIAIEAKDSLMFISKNYHYKKICINKEDVNNNNLVINLTLKPEELEEVVVIKKKALPMIKFDKNIANQLTLEKAARNPKPYGVYDGTIENGIGVAIPLGGSRKKIHQIDFKELVKENTDEKYYAEILKLKPEEIGLFIEFCDADPNSKEVLKNTNPLKLMNFLLEKNREFKKLPSH
ncbi:carboxypeptidase-like regulatory domain-containing protein [Flavobacterium nackdongense]|uniref:Carboxypeptidase-like regulatory domain-containing protein n=1 Tax=Flavobacterium nackdongense TaxID=2547394 RepID=A0A4P6YCK0_9FLAO|nr:carboxypeptidase-like regulatory domain-containing protein [Flavobacterium nackdongense]QBN19988.1 hypothetical protein E1750_14655 [Flavobacterium nackdongense]